MPVDPMMGYVDETPAAGEPRDSDIMRWTREVEQDHASHGRLSGQTSAGQWAVTEGGDIILNAAKTGARINLGAFEDVGIWEKINRSVGVATRANDIQRKALGDAIMAPPRAAQRIMRDYKPGSGEFGDEMVHDAIVAGPGALLPGFVRGAGGASDLGALGGKPLPTARRASHLSDVEMAEMNDLLRRHPEKADLIRESYNVSARESPLPRITSGRQETPNAPQRIAPSEIPEKPSEVNFKGANAFTEEELTAIRAAREQGTTYRELAQQYGVDESAIRKRLAQGGYSQNPTGRPRTAAIDDDALQLMLTMKRSGETDAAIAQTLRDRMPGEKITENMVTGYLYRMRNRGQLDADGLPFPMERDDTQWSPNPRRLTEDQVADVISRRKEGQTWAEIGADYPNMTRQSLTELVKNGGYRARTAVRKDKTDDSPPPASADDQIIVDSQRLRAQMREATDDVPMGRLDFGRAMGREDAISWASFVRTAAGIRALTAPAGDYDSEPGGVAFNRPTSVPMRAGYWDANDISDVRRIIDEDEGDYRARAIAERSQSIQRAWQTLHGIDRLRWYAPGDRESDNVEYRYPLIEK